MKQLQLHSILFLLLCVMRWGTGTEASGTPDYLESVNSSCMSMVFHQYYTNHSRLPQKPDTPCDSQDRIKEAASKGVFWRPGSTAAASGDQLIRTELKIGVPIKYGFKEFMHEEGTTDNPTTFKRGFPVDVFDAVMAQLPYNISYKFFTYENDTISPDSPKYYDSLISKVYTGKYDAVVGDVAITASRSDDVDFTYPYLEGGISMIVPVQDDDTKSPWWFLEPLTTELWVTTFAFSLLKGFLVWFFEHGGNQDFRGTPREVVGKILYFSFTFFVFSNSEKLTRNYSRFVTNMWTFLVFILVTSYGANLTSMLTVERLQPTITNINQLRSNGDFVGCQKGSFVFEFLKKMGFNESNIKLYGTIEDYAVALSKGNKNGGVAAIVEEIPYIKLFLKNHCRNYIMSQWTQRTGGLAFVFPRGSAMVPDISRAVLNFTEGEAMLSLVKDLYGDQTCRDSNSPVDNKRLPLYSLRVIFIIAGSASALAFFLYLIEYLYKTKIAWVRDKLMESGLWRLVLAIGQSLQRACSSTRISSVTPQSETEVEFSSIEGNTTDSCVIEMTHHKPAQEEDQHADEEGTGLLKGYLQRYVTM